MDRRETLRWMLSAAAAMPLAGRQVLGQAAISPAPVPATSLRDQPSPSGQQPAPSDGQAAPATPSEGYGGDPDLMKIYRAGDLWPLTLTPTQRRTAAVLCDLILPEDARSPSASAVGVVDFLDEWVSAPYPKHVDDRTLMLAGLEWLDAESQRRFAVDFAAGTADGRQAICNDICYVPKASPVFVEAAKFFARYRDLTAGGFYSSPAGRQDLGYIGNVPMAQFDGPPPELLRKLGLAEALS
jgi:hypothetical protein